MDVISNSVARAVSKDLFCARRL